MLQGAGRQAFDDAVAPAAVPGTRWWVKALRAAGRRAAAPPAPGARADRGRDADERRTHAPKNCCNCTVLAALGGPLRAPPPPPAIGGGPVFVTARLFRSRPARQAPPRARPGPGGVGVKPQTAKTANCGSVRRAAHRASRAAPPPVQEHGGTARTGTAPSSRCGQRLLLGSPVAPAQRQRGWTARWTSA